MNSIKNEVQFSKNSLTLENVELSKGYKKLFSNFNLKFKYGKIYLVVGSNGIGKTTLLKCICGLTIPDSGDIFWNNNPAFALNGLNKDSACIFINFRFKRLNG